MVHLDYNATTPVVPEVVAAMTPFRTSRLYNPSGAYPEAGGCTRWWKTPGPSWPDCSAAHRTR